MSIEEETQVSESGIEVPEVGSKLDSTDSSTEKDTDKVIEEKSLSEMVADISLKDKVGSNRIPKLTREERYAAQVEADSRSIFVGNITPEITPEIIEEHFKDCGPIKRITLLYDKNTGAPKGYAYVEFEDTESQEVALGRNGTDLKGSKISVYKKRTNLPGYRRQFQYERSNFYYQQQWNYPYGAYHEFNNVKVYPQFEHRSGGRSFGNANLNYRGKYGGKYRNTRRGNQQKNQLRNSQDISSNQSDASIDQTDIGQESQKTGDGETKDAASEPLSSTNSQAGDLDTT